MPKVRLCIAQTEPVWNCPEENMDKAASLARSASDLNAGIILFPEQSATGWDPLSKDYATDDFGYIPETFQKIAKENKIAVLGSFREKSKGLLKNTSVFFDDSGKLLAKYSKIHLFTPGCENECFSPGEKPAVFTYKGIKFGLCVCYDLRFPELFTFYAKAGCECILLQAAWPCARMKHWDIFIHSRAIENQYYVAGVNTTGKTPVDTYCGKSLVVSPLGENICEADSAEGLFFAEIDTSHVKEARGGISSLSDRREDLYIGWSRD